MRSKLPSAKKFKHWVTSEVIPSIRKTGSYGQPDLSAVISQTAAAVCAEFVRQLAPLFQAAAKMNGRSPAEGCRPWNSETCGNGFIIPDVYGANRCKLETFPEELTMQVDELLADMIRKQNLNFSMIARFCTVNGYPISGPSVKTYFQKHFS